MNKILVVGASGLVGSRFVEIYSKKYQLLTPSHQELDIASINNVKSYIEFNNPEVVINFAAYTNVGEAENERDNKSGLVWKINVEGAKNLATITKENNSFFIQISTDYIFPGNESDPGPYEESHKLGNDSSKLTWYGYTKLEAEKEIKNILGDSNAIVRIIYPVRSKFDKKLDYIRKPLSLFEQGNLYPMFTDQQVSITYIDEFCSALEKIIKDHIFGIFHVGSSDITNPYDLMSYVIEKKLRVKNVITPFLLTEFLKKVDNPVRYPIFGGLKTLETEKKLGMKFKGWREIVDDLVMKYQ